VLARPASLLVSLLVTVLLGGAFLASPATAASAEAGGIDHVEAQGRELRLLLSLGEVPAGTSPDLDSVAVTFDGTPLEAEAVPLEEAATTLRRTAVIAVDVSDSMRGAKFAAAKAAASAFLADVPDDVRVGLVTYAGSVAVAQEPTLDVAKVSSALERLSLSSGTRLYNGVQ
jgi:tight adherence protein B